MASKSLQPAKPLAMKSPFLIGVLVGLTFLFSSQAWGQEKQDLPSNKVLQISNWPLSAYEKAATDSLFQSSEIVPLIDVLSVAYQYDISDDLPAFEYSISWEPGKSVYLDGEEIDFEDLNGEVLIESIILQAEVVVNGSPVTLLTLAHDSLMSSVSPGYVSVELGSLAWNTFFADTDGSTARSYFEQGFELANAKISEISFVYFEDEPAIAEDEPTARRKPRPSRRTIYRPGISIWVDFPFYGRRPPPRVADRGTRTTSPRGDATSRGDGSSGSTRRNSDRRDTGRSADSDDGEDESEGDILSRRKKKKDDDDEEDEGELFPAAIAAVAAVAAVAVIGGTVGYYGNTENAPVGLMTGYVHPKGGILLQAAVNQALLERSKTDPEYLVGRIAGFYDFFNSPVQPMVGAGVLASQQSNDVEYEPSISLGLAGNFGTLVLLGGYDVLAGGLDFGVAYNFRAR